MKIGFRIFYKEFLGGAWKTILFIFVTTVLFSVIGFLWIEQDVEKLKEKMSDASISGVATKDFSIKMYDPISDVITLSNEYGDDSLIFVPSVTRMIASVENVYTGNNALYTIKGYEEEDLKQRFVYTEGRAPSLNSKEVALGYYMAQTLGKSVGDTLKDESVILADGMEVKIFAGLEEKPDFSKSTWPEVTVTGIVDENIGDVAYSIIMPYDKVSSDILPNVIDIYFKDSLSIDEYRSFIDRCIEKKAGIGRIEDRFVVKENARTKRFVTGIEIMLFSATTILLLMMYLCRGMGKKIGLLKSFGILNSDIYLVFSGWLSLFVMIAYSLGVIIVSWGCWLRNQGLSAFYGFDIRRYAYNFDVYMMQAEVGLLLIALVWLYIIRYTRYISPNLCMRK